MQFQKKKNTMIEEIDIVKNRLKSRNIKYKINIIVDIDLVRSLIGCKKITISAEV